MNQNKLEHYRHLLLAKRDELLASRAKAVGPVQEPGEVPGDRLDRASVESEAGIQVRLRQTESHLLRAIEEALTRITHGTFGLCRACGHPISEARLNAVPWTRLCRECKEQQH